MLNANGSAPQKTALMLALEETIKHQRSFLYHLAFRQLGIASDAEDAVQDTLLAAWHSIDQFNQRSTLRTWLVGILKHKLMDAMRHKYRPQVSSTDYDEELAQTDDSAQFNAQDEWLNEPTHWATPDDSLAQKQMLSLLEACLYCLPEQTGRIFLMREYLGFKATEIGSMVGLENGHVRMLLMRARNSLRTCLDTKLTGAPHHAVRHASHR